MQFFTHLQIRQKNIIVSLRFKKIFRVSLRKKCLCILSVIFHWQFRFSRNRIFPTYNGHSVFCSLFFKGPQFLQKVSRNIDRQISSSNLIWRLSFLTRFSHKKPRKRCSFKTFLNNKLFLLSFSSSIFLFKENFKILKRIIMLKRKVPHIKIIIIMRKFFMNNLFAIFQKLKKKEIIPFGVRKVSHFSQDLLLTFL